jgi:formate dehydrogenase subunit delta
MQPDHLEHGPVDHHAEVRARIIRMANQIATFFMSKPHGEGVAGVAAHVNDFWEPRMRRQLFEVLEQEPAALASLVREAASHIRKPGP